MDKPITLNEPSPDFIFTYSPARRKAFRDGVLWQHWRHQYPMLFDERDEQLALTMASPEAGGSHFFEWLSAILLYEATGLVSMQANFVAKNHPLKRQRFEQIVGKACFDHVDSKQPGLPDLFVYPANGIGDWFFCEVKGGPDKLRDNQKERMAELKAFTGKAVKVIKLNELKI